ncbi:MAG: hypothetical protein K5927_02200 [Lachnospiraceae bacterium]|nr:hypothetical protein [Lachnospiraceae bacterium]
MEQKVIYDRGEVKLGLGRMRKLMKLLGNPENSVPVIQIAGTNGKGSTGVFLRTALSHAGYKTGHYQTPAVLDPLEIISIDGNNIPGERLEKLKKKIHGISKTMEDAPTSFECDTAAAYMFFAEEKCDIAVIETGLGGDNDATNVTESTVLSVITPIGYDHMEFLGDTLSQIATHKAGIIKRGIPVVTTAQNGEALEVIKQMASEMRSPLYMAGKVHMPVAYQEINAGAALKAIEVLAGRFGRLKKHSDDEYARLFSSLNIFGRFCYVSSEPDIVLDGAHNLPAALALKETINRIYPGQRIIFITGCFKDKDYLSVIKSAAESPAKIFTVTPPGKRGLGAVKLKRELASEGFDASGCYSIKSAVKKALVLSEKNKKQAGHYLPIIAFGSLSWLWIVKESV